MPPSAPDSDDLAMGLGLGLGIGIPVVLLFMYMAYVYFGPKKAGGGYQWNPLSMKGTQSSLGSSAVFGTASILPATVDMGVQQKGGEPGLYAVVSGNRWFWSVGGGSQ